MLRSIIYHIRVLHNIVRITYILCDPIGVTAIDIEKSILGHASARYREQYYRIRRCRGKISTSRYRRRLVVRDIGEI